MIVKRSFKKNVPINSAIITLVSLKALTSDIGALVNPHTTIAATATYLSLCYLTIPFQVACKKAAKITAKNTFMSIVRF